MTGRRVVGIAVGAVLYLFLCSTAGVAFDQHQSQDQDKNKDKDGINVTIQSKDTDAGLVVSSQATAKQVGLPLYPGSRPHKDDKDDSSAANLGLWGNTFGFKLVVLKMESSDSPDKVAAFYQKALGKYGKVLDCTHNPTGTAEKDKNSDELTCQDDRPDAGGRMFKSGTKHKQHIVGVTPSGEGCTYQLVYLEAHSDDKNPA